MRDIEIAQRLDAKIPEIAVETREQAGRSLSYLSGAYVINRLNEVLGHGNWSYAVQRLEKVFEGKVPQRSGEVFSTSYIATVSLRAKVDGQECYYEDVGYGDGTDRVNPGKAHELAVKEAVTDGIKRAAKNLGRSMGLGLYFKDNQYIATAEELEAQRGSKRPKRPHFAVEDVPEPPLDKGQREGTKDMIRAAYRILKNQNEISSEEFKARYLQGKRMDDLSDDALVSAYKSLTRDYQQLLS